LSQIIYTGPLEGVVTPDGVLFPRGVPVDVTPELASSLLTQAFTQASDPAAPAPDNSAGQVLYSTPAPEPVPAPVPDSIPAPAPDSQGATLAPVSGVAA
jgi:hypothetical protein